MDNLKYYNDSFAYNYDIFAPAEKKKAEIHEYPNNETKQKQRSKAKAFDRAVLIRNFVISALVVAAVCCSLFLRAEISSMRSEINELNEEITALESESTRLSVEMERKISVVNLEEAAAELGMQKCEKSQVTYIQTNNIDTVETENGVTAVKAE